MGFLIDSVMDIDTDCNENESTYLESNFKLTPAFKAQTPRQMPKKTENGYFLRSGQTTESKAKCEANLLKPDGAKNKCEPRF